MIPETSRIDLAHIVDRLPTNNDFKELIEFSLQSCSTSGLARLPMLCCEATGGSTQQSRRIAEVVFLAATAATILDDVQDADTQDALWRQIGIARAINVGVSLIFAGQTLLEELRDFGILEAVISTIRQGYIKVGLDMCSGQHLDLNDRALSMEDYWQMAEAKTASFVAWGCEAGARVGCAGIDPTPYAAFGRHYGLVHQIVNDLNGLYGWLEKGDITFGKRTTLPMVFAFSVATPELSQKIDGLLKVALFNPEAQREIQTIVVNHLGFAEFSRIVCEHHYHLAYSALRDTHAPAHVQSTLAGVLDRLMDVVR